MIVIFLILTLLYFFDTLVINVTSIKWRIKMENSDVGSMISIGKSTKALGLDESADVGVNPLSVMGEEVAVPLDAAQILGSTLIL